VCTWLFILRYITSNISRWRVYCIPCFKSDTSKETKTALFHSVSCETWHIFDLCTKMIQMGRVYSIILNICFRNFSTCFVAFACRLLVINRMHCFEYRTLSSGKYSKNFTQKIELIFPSIRAYFFHSLLRAVKQ